MFTTDTTGGALRRGLKAGAVGYYKAAGGEPSSAPAEVAKRVIRGVLHREIANDRDTALTNGMHWLYGVGGFHLVYGIAVAQTQRALS
jgi:hypothetical protein